MKTGQAAVRLAPSALQRPPVESARRLYVEGGFGTGKTDLGFARVSWLMRELRGRGDQVTLLVPSRYTLRRLKSRLAAAHDIPGHPYRLTTFTGLMAQAVQLAWPALAETAGYENPAPEPRFLNLESAQHLLSQDVLERAARGQLETATRHHSPGNNRLLSQLMDNLSKAAMYGYELDGAYLRLARSVPPGRFRDIRLETLRTALRISRRFRRECLERSLVGPDLLFALFRVLLQNQSLAEATLLEPCRHLVAFDCEELDFACHRFLAWLLPRTESSLCLADPQAGFRRFLGAHPKGLDQLAELAERRYTLRNPKDSGRSRLENTVAETLAPRPAPAARGTVLETVRADPLDVSAGRLADFLELKHLQHFAETLDWTADEIQGLVRGGLPPSQVVVLAPVVSNALRFSLERQLQRRNLSLYTHRPSRMLVDEPAAQALVTFACLAHPHWRLPVDGLAKRVALQMAMEDLEGWRAHTLANIWTDEFRPFLSYPGKLQDRVGNRFGIRFDAVRSWLHDYRREERYEPLDLFLARLFDELLSLPGFSFGRDADASRTAHQLMHSAFRFRLLLQEIGFEERADRNPFQLEGDIGRIYVELIQGGLIGSLHVPDDSPPADAVVLASAYNFLMQNYKVERQFWLETDHQSWARRVHQPLTHPYVLASDWPGDRPWTDEDEHLLTEERLCSILTGLLRRTGRRVHVPLSQYGETGQDQKGPLTRAVRTLFLQEKMQQGGNPFG